ncbi:MAG TPA: S8 family serine peptidase [Nannocystaceae bacterium]|nr:S8 family serine peptidase [Nannocystaceae bacterium]
MIEHAPDLPFSPERTRACLRGRVTVKLAPDRAPDSLPHYLAVARGVADAATRIDGGRIDAVLRKHSPATKVTRAFRAARERATAGAVVRPHWDSVEQETGLSRTLRIDVDPAVGVIALCNELAELAGVEGASPCYLTVTPFAKPAPPKPSNPLYAYELVGAARALAFEPGDSALVVGIVDSGIFLEHAELEGRWRSGADTVDLPHERLSRGLTLIGDADVPDLIPRDEMGHGTACASIIAARGLRVPRGVGGACWVLPMRALAAARMSERRSLTAIGAVPDIDEACKLAIDLGARVLNCSFGTPESALREGDPIPHADVVEYARQRGCVLVAASGNDGKPTAYYPAALPGVIAVGSVGETGKPSSFTTRGDHVALCAPGEHIVAAGLSGYQTNTGTSFAAPFVAGACALLVARAARYAAPLDVDDVRELLVATARPFAVGSDTTGCGAGILDIPAALAALEERLAARDRPMTTRAFGEVAGAMH